MPNTASIIPVKEWIRYWLQNKTIPAWHTLTWEAITTCNKKGGLGLHTQTWFGHQTFFFIHIFTDVESWYVCENKNFSLTASRYDCLKDIHYTGSTSNAKHKHNNYHQWNGHIFRFTCTHKWNEKYLKYFFSHTTWVRYNQTPAV